MLISPKILKKIIYEAIDAMAEEEPQTVPQMGAREKKVAAATETGAMIDAEKYANILKRVLLTPKVAPQARLVALQSVFGQKGTTIDTLIKQMIKGAQN